MNSQNLIESVIILHGAGVGEVSRGMIRDRAIELAEIGGRQPYEVSKSDWDDAKRELTDGHEQDPRQISLESLPESARWDPVPGSEGCEAPVAFDDNEDADGRGVGERLVEAGTAEAVHDLMLEAARINLSDNP